MTAMLSQLDDLTKYIQDKLAENHLAERVNVIHLSDHGMIGVTPQKAINLTDFVRNGTVTYFGASPVLQVVPNDRGECSWTLIFRFGYERLFEIAGLLDEIYKNLTRGAQKNGHFKVYTPTTLPKRLRAANARRIGPLFVVADLNYTFQDIYDTAVYMWKQYNITSKTVIPMRDDRRFLCGHLTFEYWAHSSVSVSPTTKYGFHGYDNDEHDMHAFFMAKGPQIARGKRLKPFKSVDLYNLFCRILKIKCRPNEGTDRTSTWNEMLRPSKARSTRSAQKPLPLLEYALFIYRKIRSLCLSMTRI